MKKILLIEDDQNKIKNITNFFEQDFPGKGEILLSTRKSYQSGLEAILNNPFDLILLDMSMHNFDKTSQETGGEFMQFAGEDILGEMDWNSINIKTIIVTQYDLIGNKSLEELKIHWKERFPLNYLGTVYYSANETNWKNELLDFIKNHL